jgi:hypothetical protein
VAVARQRGGQVLAAWHGRGAREECGGRR